MNKMCAHAKRRYVIAENFTFVNLYIFDAFLSKEE
jgi:hypothetical protein